MSEMTPEQKEEAVKLTTELKKRFATIRAARLFLEDMPIPPKPLTEKYVLAYRMVRDGDDTDQPNVDEKQSIGFLDFKKAA